MKYVVTTSNLPWDRPVWEEKSEYGTQEEARAHFLREVEGALSGGDGREVVIREVEGQSGRSVAKASVNGFAAWGQS